MAVGGLTPPIGLVKAARQIFDGPIIAMVRPREGGFCYSLPEFLQIMDDGEIILSKKIDGLAVGFLTADGTVDIPRCRKLRALFPQAVLVFHKAFDVTPDLNVSLKQLIDCGFNRILTSGGQPTASQGLRQLKELITLAADQIEILPGGGIRANNVRELLRHTGCRQIHSAVRELVRDSSTIRSDIHFGPADQDAGSFGRVSSDQLQELLDTVRNQRS
jgi:copper homeostasis protein